MKLNKMVLGLGAFVLIALALIAYSLSGRREHFVGGPDQPVGKFTMYQADWCPHCQRVKPSFAEFAADGVIDVGGKKIAVEMVQPEKEPEKAKGVNVKGFPTFLYSDAAGKVVEYEGPRSPDGWLAFIKKQILG